MKIAHIARAGSAQRGQALTEFLLVALALVPLFLLMPVLARLQDVSHSVQMAARYVAFEAMARHPGAGGFKPEAQLAAELRRRFFGDTGGPIHTREGADDEVGSQRHAFWRRPDGSPLIRSFADVQMSFGRAQGASHTQGLSPASDGHAFPLHQRLELSAHGLYTAQVSVRLADLPAGLKAYEPFDRIGLVVARSTSVAIDPWSARDPAQVQDRLDDTVLFPGRVLRATTGLLKPIVALAELPGDLKPPRLGRLDFWQDVVPADALHRP
jgi:hypothetical protein